MITVGELRELLKDETIPNDGEVRVYLDMYCTTNDRTIMRRVNEERNAFRSGSDLCINVGTTFELKDYTTNS